MADSEVAICNLALLKIGDTAGLISSLEDPSLEGQVCKLEYPQTRDELFAKYRWPRATRHAYPAQLGGAQWAVGTPYVKGAFVSYQPAAGNVVNMPETIATFVYVALAANTGAQPDISPGSWAQVSRAAWAYVFQLPGDVLEVQGLYRYGRNLRHDQAVPYEIGNDPILGTLLYTDTGLPWLQDWTNTNVPHSIELVYTAQVTDPKQFPPLFTKALYWALAVKFALEIRKDPDEAKKADVEAVRAENDAYVAARSEVPREPPPPPSWLAARATRGPGR